MPKDTLLPSQPKGVYRVKNWPEYNAGLIERGNVTVWMDERMFLPASQTPCRGGIGAGFCRVIGGPPAQRKARSVFWRRNLKLLDRCAVGSGAHLGAKTQSTKKKA